MIIKTIEIPKDPKLGEKRIVKCFALLPKKIESESNVTTIFFHTYYKEYEFKKTFIRPPKSVRYIDQIWVLTREFI